MFNFSSHLIVKGRSSLCARIDLLVGLPLATVNISSLRQSGDAKKQTTISYNVIRTECIKSCISMFVTLRAIIVIYIYIILATV